MTTAATTLTPPAPTPAIQDIVFAHVSDAVFATDLAAVVRGVAARPSGRPTLFKSVGFGLADLFVARLLA